MATAAVDVAFVTNGVGASDQNDILAYLSADPRLGTVTLFQADVAVPALASLLPFDAVMYTSDAFNHERNNDAPLGDVLADYVDAGRGVLLTTFAWGSQANDLGLLGRMMTTGYSPYLLAPGQAFGGTLDLVASNLAHPTMAGVNTFTSRFSNGDLTLDAGAMAIAFYTDGDGLLAENASRRIVGLNAFPSPGTSRGEIFLTGDFARLVTNSLVYVAAIPEPTTAISMLIACAALVAAARRR